MSILYTHFAYLFWYQDYKSNNRQGDSMEFVTIAEAIDTGLIPEPWAKYFRRECIHCQKPIEISTSRRIMRCSNPKCYIKIAGSCADLLKRYGIKGYAVEKCKDHMRASGIKSVTEFLMNPPWELAPEIEEIRKKPLTFKEAVALLGLPHMQSRALDVFAGINSMSDFLEQIKSYQGNPYDFLFSRLGGDGVLVSDIGKTIAAFVPELMEINSVFTIANECSRTICIAITGPIVYITEPGTGKKFSREGFVEFVNSITRQMGIQIKLSSGIESVECIVNDVPSEDRKYLAGKRRGILISSPEFLELLQKEMTVTNGDN